MSAAHKHHSRHVQLDSSLMPSCKIHYYAHFKNQDREKNYITSDLKSQSDINSLRNCRKNLFLKCNVTDFSLRNVFEIHSLVIFIRELPCFLKIPYVFNFSDI